MGVPKFFRWCAERYPSVITPFKDSPPPVDNLYLDINGIIHNCTHPNDIDATRRAPTEKEMIQAMFGYLEKLFNAIQPRKFFLLAVDGVAPRAKMNQQRQRRYRAGYEMMVAREEAITMGEDVPEEKDVFDSNCITPGTPFMVRVSKEFQYFITSKIASDPAWQTCTVIFSGHDCPGEGEHKIVDFIRRRKSQPGYDANETHCMYGLDADLVMLALATHEPHFVLLREVVSFGPGSRKERQKLEEDTARGIVTNKAYHKADEFVLFHINVFRDYLQIDVRERLLKNELPTKFDLERVLDDFVFMCFFIGNDFLPTLPTVGINDGSMNVMLDLYVTHILSKGLFLTREGTIDWRATEVWLSELGKLEFSTIRTRQQEEADYQRRAARSDRGHEVTSVTATAAIVSIEEYKHKFYTDKHGFDKGWDPTGRDIKELNLHYLEGLAWVIAYYYQGVPSWQWFFPHYYAPMASDLVNLPALAAKIKFDLGKPFLPHQQLLAVLPPMSYRSIPTAYWLLLKSSSSPLARFFPEHIQIDREGARAPWEGIVIIPFIDEDVLLAAYQSVQQNVSPEDARNNVNGPSLRFFYDGGMAAYELEDDMFGTLKDVHVVRQMYEFPSMDRPFVPRLCDGVLIGDRQLEGFSSLQSKRENIKPAYEVGAVSIFGMPTRKESMLLGLGGAAKSAADVVSLVGKEILVGFPHYKRARVATVSDARSSYAAEYSKDGNFVRVQETKKNRDQSAAFIKEAETHQRYMKSKLGIAVEEVEVLVYVHRFTNMRLTNKNRVVRQFATSETAYPLALCSRLESVSMREDSRYVERDRAEADTAFGAKCVYIGRDASNKRQGAPNIRGCCGVVTQESGDQYHVTLKVYTTPLVLPPSLSEYAGSVNWVPLYEAANSLQISGRTLSTLCSSMVTSPQFGSREVGLCLKFTGRNLARVGYAKLVQRSYNPWYLGNVDVFARMERDSEDTGHHLENAEKGDFVGNSSVNRSGTGTWYLSRRAVELARAFITRFSPLVQLIESGAANMSQLDPPNFMTGVWREREATEVLDEIEEFINSSGVAAVPMATATEDIFPNELIAELEDTLEAAGDRPTRALPLSRVFRKDLYFPTTRSAGGHLVQLPLPLEQTFRLGDRVMNCRATGGTPFGSCGTIVRVLASGREAEVVYDAPFTAGDRLDGRLRTPRAAIAKLASLLVLRDKFEESKEGQLEAVKAATAPITATVNNNNNNNNNSTAVGNGGSGLDASPVTTHISAKGAGGINLLELAKRVPSASPSPVSLHTNTAAAAAGQAHVDPQATQAFPTSTSNNNNNDNNGSALTFVKGQVDLSHAPKIIPEVFVSGRMRTTYKDAALNFQNITKQCLEKELAQLRLA